MSLIDSLDPMRLAAAPLASWLLIVASGGLGVLSLISMLVSLARASFGLFFLSFAQDAAAGWLLSWMMGLHDGLQTDARLAGWACLALVITLTTVSTSRLFPFTIACVWAVIPLLVGLGIADATAGRSVEWRMVGADRATIIRDLGLQPWLGESRRQALDERKSWSDVAEAWRNYAEETRKLDAAIGPQGGETTTD